MLSLSKERRDHLLKKAAKLYLSLGSGGYTRAFITQKRPHEGVDCLNEPILNENNEDSHEITFEKKMIGGKTKYQLAITFEWLLSSGLVKPGESVFLDYSEYLIKNEDGQVLRRYSCIPKRVRSNNFKHEISLA